MSMQGWIKRFSLGAFFIVILIHIRMGVVYAAVTVPQQGDFLEHVQYAAGCPVPPTNKVYFETVGELIQGVQPQFKAGATEGTPKRFIFCQN